MACKADVKQAILNKVMDEAVEGRYTFQRLSDDTIMINGRVDDSNTKAKTTAQALAIANQLAKTTEQSFYGHVKGEVSQASKYDPVTVKFHVSDAYISHVFDGLPNGQKNDSQEVLSPNRDHINTNTGPNSYQQHELFDVGTVNQVGAFTKYLQFKSAQLREYQRRLSNVQLEKKKAGKTVEELTKLNNQERELKLQIEGNYELNIKGLKQEIADLKAKAETISVQGYVEKDLDRLDKLANSDDIDDLREAQRLIDFYNLAGTFRKNVDNPFFEQEEIFLEDDNGGLSSEIRLPEEVTKQYKEWADKANAYQNIIDKKKEEITVNTVNNDGGVRNTYGNKQFTFNDLVNSTNGLKDVDWISMWTMDITNGIFSNNGIIPQVMFSYLSNSINKKLAWVKDIEERVDHLSPKVQAELMKLHGGKYSLRGAGILGIKGASYQIFKEITKEGNETGGLVQRFIKEFFDAQSKAQNTFSDKFQKTWTEEDYGKRSRDLNAAFEELKRWRRKNTMIMDLTRLPEFSETTDNSYKQSLIDVLGQKGYEEQVERQKGMLTKYEAEKQSILETALQAEGVDQYDLLSEKAKNELHKWEFRHSPFKGIEDYHSVEGIYDEGKKENSYMDYNNLIPRKYEAEATKDGQGKVQFKDTKNETGFYSEGFKEIENNPILHDFYKVIKEVCETMREHMSIEDQQKMSPNTIPALQKTSAEMIADKSNGILSSIIQASRHLMERVKMGFGTTKQSGVSYATIDPITGRANYKVNDTFLHGNTGAVAQRMTIEKTKFLQALNIERSEEDSIKVLKRFSSFPLDSLNTQALILLNQYLHLDVPLSDIQARRLDAFRKITGAQVEIGKYIRDFSLHSVVQSQSFDLAKISKYFADLTMLYAARQEALPILEVMKQHYQGIQKPRTNNLGNGIYNVNHEKNMMDGLRTNGNKQMDDWFERVALGNYDTKHLGPVKSDKLEAMSDKVNKKTEEYRTIYSREEKRKIKEINELIKNERDEDKVAQLQRLKEGMGKVITATAIFDNLMGMVRLKNLGFNLSSATTNFLEGVTSNVILGSMGEYFDPKELYFGYGVVKHSFLKNLSFGKAETKAAQKNRSLMDKYNVLMDNKNELQKSSTKSHADRLSFMNPYEMNSRVEYINQSPIMIAMLRTMKVTGIDGTKSSIWDAYNEEGHLKDNFRTEENIKNWEELTGEDYLTFKQRLHKAIVLGHGNYDELRGMMIKSNSAGKALAMFKTWLPMAIYWRFAQEQDDIQSGTKGFKGRYLSYTKGSAAIHGAAIGLASFGPLGFAIGGAIGGALGHFFGVQTEVSLTKDLLTSAKALAKKSIGLPVNMMSGMIASKRLFNDDSAEFDKWVGSGEFTAQDARNLRGNMADISMQLMWLALVLIAKGMFYSDDDDPNSPKRKAHNIMVNKLMQLSSQASSYTNPVTMYKTMVGDNGVVSFLTESIKEIDKVVGFVSGKDIAAGGPNRGKSQLLAQTKKLIMPGMFKDHMLGFDSQSQRQFTANPYDDYFHSEEYLDKRGNKSDRAGRALQLEEQWDVNKFQGEDDLDRTKAKKKAIKKELDFELPTPTKLHKMGMTRKEYIEAHQEELKQSPIYAPE